MECNECSTLAVDYYALLELSNRATKLITETQLSAAQLAIARTLEHDAQRVALHVPTEEQADSIKSIVRRLCSSISGTEERNRADCPFGLRSRAA